MQQEFDELDQLIIGTLNDFLREDDEVGYKSDRLWTNKIKERLGRLGEEREYQIATSGFKGRFENEWLYDMVWYEEDDQKRLIRIPLIVESEWNIDYKYIKYDFEKLLVGNAERRLMICKCSPENLDNLLNNFQEAIEAFKENYGDRFLFAILDCKSEGEFHYRTYVKKQKSKDAS